MSSLHSHNVCQLNVQKQCNGVKLSPTGRNRRESGKRTAETSTVSILCLARRNIIKADCSPRVTTGHPSFLSPARRGAVKKALMSAFELLSEKPTIWPALMKGVTWDLPSLAAMVWLCRHKVFFFSSCFLFVCFRK